jgi:serine/threonine protein kinase
LSEDFPAWLPGFRAGELLAGYRLEAQVGAGGMAVVFRARDERLDRPVALKILAPAVAADPAFRRRFIVEARRAAAVDDPHIIPIYEAGEAGGALFIAMRFVKGGDLRQMLDREGPLPPVRAAGFISPVASALDAAHGAGLVHRDVKPANILVDTRQGRPDHVYLSDFGVSKGAVSVSLTGAGQFVGTPEYSAPEQIKGEDVDGRTDQYALACVAYQLLTGAMPFERDQGMAVLLAHLSEPPPSLVVRRPGLPSAADQVLAKGLAKVPEKRFGSCEEFANALREALGLAPYSSPDFAVASDHPKTAKTARAVPASTIDSKLTGRAADQARLAAAAPVSAVNVPTGSLGTGGASGGLTGGVGRRVAAERASAANIGDARADVHDAEPTGTVAGNIGVIASATVGRLWAAVSSLMSRLARSGSLAAVSEKGAAARPRGSHHARAERTARARRRWPIISAALVVLVGVVAGGIYIFDRVSQNQYYVAANGGQVVVNRGINYRILGISLFSLYARTGIPLAQVPANYEQAVLNQEAAGSLSLAQATVGNVSAAVSQCRTAYLAQENWVTKENAYQVKLKAYQAKVAAAREHRTPNPGSPPVSPGPPPIGAGQRPSSAGGLCPQSTAYDIAASALSPESP